jgi:TolB-like protein/DNA-binding winged helix-turn-helix (wHTH) protein
MARQIRFGVWCFDPDTHRLAMGKAERVLEPRVSRLLEFLLEHHGETLSHDRLVDGIWDGRVVSNEAVRRAVSMLRHALSADGKTSCIRTVRKKGYVALFEPPDPEVQPQQSAEESPQSAGEPQPEAEPQPEPKLPWAAAPPSPQPRAYVMPRWQRVAWARGMVVLVAGAVAFTLLARGHVISPAEPRASAAGTATTLAVLPFQNLSADPGSSFLSDGVSEELLDTLARYQGLQVTARDSAFRFRDAEIDVHELGRQIGVRQVLQGSVLRIDDRLRIDARLTDTLTGRAFWSGTRERPLAELFDLQQEIATEVARELQVLPVAADTGNAAARKASVEAHLEFLRARERLATWTVADTEQAMALLQRAIALDPGYAAAYVHLADAIMIRALSTDGLESVRTTVEPLLDKALALDPTLGEAYVMRGWLIEDPRAAEHEMRKGLSLSPSYARGYEMMAGRLMELPGRQDETLRLIDRALALDPLSPRNLHIKALFRAKLGDIESAEELERRALELEPRFRPALLSLGWLSALRGEFAAAVAYGERALAIDPRATFVREALVQLYLSAGEPAAARSVNHPATRDGPLSIRLFEQDWDGAVAGIRDAASKQDHAGAARYLDSFARLRYALDGGGAASAVTALSQSLGYDGTLPTQLSTIGCRAYIDLAQLLLAKGDAAAAQRLRLLLEQKLDGRAKEAPGEARMLEVNRAMLLAQAGRDRDALAALERAFAPTPLRRWWLLLQHPAFDHLRREPRFQAIVARTALHVARQGDQLAEMRRLGRVPDRAAQNQR